MKQRVIFVSSVFDGVDTGPGIYARYLWEAFRDDEEIDFHLVVPKSSERHEHIHEAGIGKNSFDTYERLQRTALELARSTGSRALVHGNAAHSMFKFLHYEGPWVVQVNDYEAAKVWRRPREIISERGIRRFGSLAWRHWQEGRVITAASRVVTNSSFTLQEIRANYGESRRSKYMRIYKSVDTADFMSESECHDPFPDRPFGARIVFIGSDWRRKGLADLLDALKTVSIKWPNAHLTVGGPSDSQDLEEIEAIVTKNGLSECVLLAGRIERDKLISLHRNSDIFVLPSHEEALGVALLEAMAAGLPVVAADVGGISEIVADGQNGLTFPRGDTAQLAVAIERLLSDSSLRERMSANGLQTAGKFDINTMISSVRDMYRLVLSEFVE